MSKIMQELELFEPYIFEQMYIYKQNELNEEDMLIEKVKKEKNEFTNVSLDNSGPSPRAVIAHLLKKSKEI